MIAWITRCIVCGDRPRDPANLLDVCGDCTELLARQDDERFDVDPHTRFVSRYPLVRRSA